MTMKNVIQFLGSGYSGGTLLNLLLDSIHGVRALGEIRWMCQRYEPSAEQQKNHQTKGLPLHECSCIGSCMKEHPFCQFYQGHNDHFYDHVFWIFMSTSNDYSRITITCRFCCSSSHTNTCIQSWDTRMSLP